MPKEVPVTLIERIGTARQDEANQGKPGSQIRDGKKVKVLPGNRERAAIANCRRDRRKNREKWGHTGTRQMERGFQLCTEHVK